MDAACARCAVALPYEGLCGECLRHARAFDAATACYEYRFPVDRLIQRFKYAGDLALGRWLGARVADRVRGQARPDLLVVPPLAGATLHERGFNQALEIAKVVARALAVPLDRDAVARCRETRHQAGLSRRERRTNLRGAFACRRSLEGLCVAIVDDVMTTGATADAIAATLKSAGAARVSVWVVARAPEPAD